MPVLNFWKRLSQVTEAVEIFGKLLDKAKKIGTNSHQLTYTEDKNIHKNKNINEHVDMIINKQDCQILHATN